MERYNYYDAVLQDVLDYMEEHDIENNAATINPEYIDIMDDPFEVYNKLYDALWIDDGVTGNASGSYYCNTWKAEEALCHNFDLLIEATIEFCCEGNLIEMGAESCDVTIRCYMLSQVLPEAMCQRGWDY